MPNPAPPPHVLIVDDDPALLTLLAETMLESGAPKTVSTAEDGSRALQMLLGGMRPNLIILDLKMPEVPGDEVLGRVKSDPTLSRIPVIVLTASDAEADIAKCLRLRANS